VSVKRRSDGRWRVDVVVKIGSVRHRERAAAATQAAGHKLEREIRARLARGEVTTEKAPTFEAWGHEFLAVYPASNNKASEQHAKKRIFELHLCPYFGAIAIDRIDVERIEKFKAAQLTAEQPTAPKTLNNRLTVLRKMLSVAHEWGKLSRAPKVKMVKVPPPEFRFLAFEEAERLVASAAQEWRAMVLVALRTGLRRGELLALRWEDVNLAAATIKVQRSVWKNIEGPTKSNRVRTVPLSPEALATMRELPTRFAKGYVFGDGRTRLTVGALKWPLYAACDGAGIARAGWHVLRHTFASHLAMRGVMVKAIQELLGHSDIKTTLMYAHLSPAIGESAVSLLDGRDPIRTRTESKIA
jgi:integrase